MFISKISVGRDGLNSPTRRVVYKKHQEDNRKIVFHIFLII